MNRMMNRGGGGAQGMIPGGPLGKARYALALGRPDEAERIARKRLERQPDDVAARVLLAQALLQMRMVEEAIAEARRATRDAPTSADAHMTLSAALLQKGRFRVPAEAETAAKRAVQLQPKLARARVQLAEVLAANNDNNGALLAADEAIKLEPRGPSGYFVKAVTLMRMKDYEGAVQAAESTLRFDRDKQLSQAELIRAQSLVEVKRYDDALAALDAAEHANPLLGGAQSEGLRGRIFFKQRKFGESYRTHQEAQRRNGRGNLTAPPLAALNMVFMGIFGERGPWAMLYFFFVIVVAIIWAVSLIPVAGPWASTGLIVVGLLVLALASVRQVQGSVLPMDRSLWTTTIPAIAAAFIIGGVATLYLTQYIVGFFTHNPPLFNPTSVTIAGIVASVLAGLAAYGWPLLMARYGGGKTRAA